MKNNANNTGNLDGYKPYPPAEDIYNNGQIDAEVDPEDITKPKQPVIPGKEDAQNEKGFTDDKPGASLDVPGAELDDEDEMIGEEDEENNYYSIGGDEHNDLDEPREWLP